MDVPSRRKSFYFLQCRPPGAKCFNHLQTKSEPKIPVFGRTVGTFVAIIFQNCEHLLNSQPNSRPSETDGMAIIFGRDTGVISDLSRHAPMVSLPVIRFITATCPECRIHRLGGTQLSQPAGDQIGQQDHPDPGLAVSGKLLSLRNVALRRPRSVNILIQSSVVRTLIAAPA
jgi:hypothetical protein